MMDIQKVREDGMPTSYSERVLRRMLCVSRHGTLAYMDDGEASFCGDEYYPGIDYMRDDPLIIEKKLRIGGQKLISEQYKITNT